MRRTDRLGEMLAEFIAERLGSWAFVFWQSVAIAIWIAWNWLGPSGAHVDPPPFIGLNLLLSLQAAYTGPVLLIAANRVNHEDHKRLHRMEHELRSINSKLDKMNEGRGK